MSNVRHLPTPATRMRTFAALATERHRLAITRKLAGNIDGYEEAMATARQLDEMAARERERQVRIEDQDAERRRQESELQASMLVLGEIELATVKPNKENPRR